MRQFHDHAGKIIWVDRTVGSPGVQLLKLPCRRNPGVVDWQGQSDRRDSGCIQAQEYCRESGGDWFRSRAAPLGHAFWSSMSVVVPTNLRTFPSASRKGHGLLEMPAIGPVLSAERPGFECKTLSQAHSVPKGPRCCFAILGVDCGHPGLGMRADEIEGLSGEFKPNSIHEIRCPIRLERPGGYRKMLQQSNLELQLFVGFGEFAGSFRDSPIEFIATRFCSFRRSACCNPIAN